MARRRAWAFVASRSKALGFLSVTANASPLLPLASAR
jgi:hypothetical protein